MELRAALQSLDRPTASDELVVVLALYEYFAGNLSALIDRARTADRLIVSTADRSVPEQILLHSIAARPEELGWRNISFNNEASGAIEEILRSSPQISTA